MYVICCGSRDSITRAFCRIIPRSRSRRRLAGDCRRPRCGCPDHRDGGDAGADEVKVFFDTEQIDPRSDAFFEMRLPREPGWSNVAHVRRPENRKTPAAPVLRVMRAGWHTLWLVKGAEPEAHGAEPPLTRRYPNWRIDKMVLFRDASRVPSGDGPQETRDGGHVPPPSRESLVLPIGAVSPAPAA